MSKYGGLAKIRDCKREEKIRRADRHWATNTFPNNWRDQFEIHHDWLHGGRILFLTKREHTWIHRKRRI
jgi:hypothetical protein